MEQPLSLLRFDHINPVTEALWPLRAPGRATDHRRPSSSDLLFGSDPQQLGRPRAGDLQAWAKMSPIQNLFATRGRKGQLLGCASHEGSGVSTLITLGVSTLRGITVLFWTKSIPRYTLQRALPKPLLDPASPSAS